MPSTCLQEMEHLDPHQRPPDSIRDGYKKYQKMKPKDLDQDPDIVDVPKSLHTSAKDKVRIVEEWSADDLTAAFRAFSGQEEQTHAALQPRIPVYEHSDMPGRTLFRFISYETLPVLHDISLSCTCHLSLFVILSSLIASSCVDV